MESDAETWRPRRDEGAFGDENVDSRRSRRTEGA